MAPSLPWLPPRAAPVSLRSPMPPATVAAALRSGLVGWLERAVSPSPPPPRMVCGEVSPSRVRISVAHRRTYSAFAPCFIGQIESDGQGGSIVTGRLGARPLARRFLILWLSGLGVFAGIVALAVASQLAAGRSGQALKLAAILGALVAGAGICLAVGRLYQRRASYRAPGDEEFLRDWLAEHVAGPVRST